MAIPEYLLRNLLAGHANVDIVCRLSADATAAAERATAAAERATEREREALMSTIAALQQALELVKAGVGGGGGGGGGRDGAAGAARPCVRRQPQ